MPKKTHSGCHPVGVQMTSSSPTEGTCPLQVPRVHAVIAFSFSSVFQGLSGHWFSLKALWVILICPQRLEPLIWLLIGKNTFWQNEREKFDNTFLKTFNEHFTDEEPETQRHEATCSSLNNEQPIGQGLEPIIISFTKYQVLSMTSGRRRDRRQKLGPILGKGEERGDWKEKGHPEDFLRKGKMIETLQIGLQPLSLKCMQWTHLGMAGKWWNFFYLLIFG